MTTQEFSIEFDILYNNLASNTAPPLNEYEKSVFLTKAQSDIVLELYSGRNQLGLSFESSEEVRKYLFPLIKSDAKEFLVSTDKSSPIRVVLHDSNMWVILKEHLICSIGNTASPTRIIIPIVPITHDEYYKLKENPFRSYKKGKRALRLDAGKSSDTGNSRIEILYDYSGERYDFKYSVTYLQRPTPIILDGILDTTLTIENVPVATSSEHVPTNIVCNPKECLLDPSLHRMILDRAVLYAKQAYIGGQAQA